MDLDTLRGLNKLSRVSAWTIFNYLGITTDYKLGGLSRERQMHWMMNWGKAVCRSMGIAIDLYGQPHDGPVIYVANHRSYADIPIILSHIPTFCLAKHEVSRWPIFGLGANAAGAVFVKREKKQSRRDATTAIHGRIEEGYPVLLFPEGTTVKGEPKPFKPGSFYLAAEQGIPVVPVALEYHHPDMAWTDASDWSFITHFLQYYNEPSSKVRLSIGPKMEDDDPHRLKDRAREFILDELIVPT